MITQFQRLIHRHGRWIFLILLGVILCAFVLWDYAGFMSSFRDQGEESTSHTLYGKKIGSHQFEIARRVYVLNFQWHTGQNPENFFGREQVAQKVVERLALLEKARRLGIRVPDSELIEQIQKDPNFQKDGRYDPSLYSKIMVDYVIPRGITEGDFAEMFRGDMIIQRMVDFLGGTIKITSFQSSRVAAEKAEKITAVAVSFEGRDFKSQVKATDPELETYYQNHLHSYQSPEKIRVAYATFPIQADGAKVEDKKVEEYYQSNQAEYTQPDGKVKPLKEVTDAIRKKLAHEAARGETSRKAMDFATKLIPEPGKMEDLAKEFGVKSGQTGFITPSDKAAGIEAPSFAADVFKLTSENPVGDPIIGDKFVYVPKFLERQPSAPLPLKEVKEKVKEGYILEESSKLAREAGEKRRKEVVELMEKGKSFDEAVRSLKLKTQTFKSFSQIDNQSKPGLEGEVRRVCYEIPAKTLTEFEISETGGYFAYVTSREKAPLEEVGKIQMNVNQEMTQKEKQKLLEEFQKAVLEEAGIPKAKV